MPTFSEQIDQDGDDGYYLVGYGWGVYDFYLNQGVGFATALAGVRFVGVTVPQGATVVSATVTFTLAFPPGASGPVGRLFGNDVDDAEAWSSSSNPSTMVRTAAYTSLDGADEVIDVAAQVQEIIDRGGWASGNAMRFGGGSTGAAGDVLWQDYANAPSDAAILDIEYTEGGGGYFTFSATIAG